MKTNQVKIAVFYQFIEYNQLHDVHVKYIEKLLNFYLEGGLYSVASNGLQEAINDTRLDVHRLYSSTLTLRAVFHLSISISTACS